jgi:putative aminopeptidase FrvX
MLSIGSTQIKLLEKLCNSMSVSGDEGEVRRIVLEEVKPYADEVKVDALGSVLVRKTGTGKKPLRVLLDAHMDEVGFMIVNDDSDGFFQFETVGGIDPRHLVGKQVIVGRDHTLGVIGVNTPSARMPCESILALKEKQKLATAQPSPPNSNALDHPLCPRQSMTALAWRS